MDPPTSSPPKVFFFILFFGMWVKSQIKVPRNGGLFSDGGCHSGILGHDCIRRTETERLRRVWCLFHSLWALCKDLVCHTKISGHWNVPGLIIYMNF